MTNRKLLILFAALLMIFTLAVSASAQGTGRDSDGDGVADSEDRCPRQPAPNTLDGCPGSPTLTPQPVNVEDRDGDGVLDFVDRCPDQAGTGFTEGCPTTGDSGTPVPPPFQWETFTACMVANLGIENVNIRAFIPNPNDPAQPVFLGVLLPGQQFAPMYVQYDVNNTPWYAGVGAELGLADGQIGWVNGVVTTNNGVCDYLPAPPTTIIPPADRRICLIFVPEGEDVRVVNFPDADEITRLEPGSLFPANAAIVDEAGVPWYRGYFDRGWVRGLDIIAVGDCNPTIPMLPPEDEDGLVPFGGGQGGMCVVLIPDGDGVHMYNALSHDPAGLVATLQPGVAFQAQFSGTDSEGHLWYNGGGWVDSAEVIATGNCENLPMLAPPESDVCQILMPSWNPDVNMYHEPAADPAQLIYAIPAGMVRTALAKTWDTGGQIWYWANYGQGGWVSGSQVIVLNETACNELVDVIPPSDPNACLITIPEGEGVTVYMAPAHEDSLAATILPPGFIAFVDFADVVLGTVWYNVGGYVDGHQVITSGNCDNLPPFVASSGDNMCVIYVPSDSNLVPVFSHFEVIDADSMAALHEGFIGNGNVYTALYAATNSLGGRWYYVKSISEGAEGVGWVNSADVIESPRSACDALPPMMVFHLPDIFLELAIKPIVYPLPDPYFLLEY